jgi:TrmH family RNA methyltransferase
MSPGYDISSATNERVKRLVRLGRRRHRDEEGVYLVEGPRLVGRALEAGLHPLEVYGDGTVDIGLPMVTMHPAVLDRVSYRERSEGLIAVFPQARDTLAGIEPSPRTLLLAAEGVEKPGNLGGMLRTAAAVGADAVVLVSGRVDRFNPNVLRASTGACFQVPIVETGLADLVSWLAESGVALVAADAAAPTPYWDADLRSGVAIILGSEDRGLSSLARSSAAAVVSVPMIGPGIDSLNLSVTMALLAFEAVRQRTTR